MMMWFVNGNMPPAWRGAYAESIPDQGIGTRRVSWDTAIMDHATEPVVSPFGARLRRWRAYRGLSQLALATTVGSTARHLSFLETGRSRPSRQMVLRLGEALGVSLRERNQLLHAAGLPVTYPQADLRGTDLAPFRAALDRLLRAHLPYPALVLDAYGTVVLANRAGLRLFGADLVGTNIIRRFLIDPAAPQAIVNWPEVAWAGFDRLRHQLDQAPFDERLGELVSLAQSALADVPRTHPPSPDPVVCPWFRIDGEVVKTIGMVARFESSADITLDELRIELTYPLDAHADRVLRDLLHERG
jgi:transcriptional regulator with XRE-family HTH domain